jgi:hypothetical protein
MTFVPPKNLASGQTVALGGGGGAAPRWCVIEPEKTGAQSAGARSAAKNH